MAEYLDIPFESDPDALSQIAFDYLQSAIPNWVPSEGHLDVMLIRALAHIAAEVQDIASAVPTTIFRYLGASVFQLPPIDAIAAQAPTTWVMRDNAGYTIPAATLVGIRASGDVLVPFQTLVDVIVPPGSTTTASGAVIIEAVTPGAAGSGLSGTAEMIDALGFVDSITLEDPTSGGQDAESDDTYLNRLTTQLQLLAPRPILPTDFSLMAVDVPGVFRATTLDGYNPVDDSYDNERMVTIAAIDENGAPVSSTVKSNLQQFFDERREVNFVINVIDPTITAIDVTYEVEAEPGFTDIADVQARVDAAIAQFLDASTWGLPTSGDQIIWINDSDVRYLSLATVIKDVQGVWHVIGLTLGLAGGPQDSVTVTMPGAIALPTAGTLAGTIDLAGTV